MKIKKHLNYLALIILVLIMLVPFLWIITTSLKDFISITSSKLLFTPTLDNYKNLFFGGESDYPRYFLNSTIVVLTTVAIAILIGSLGAYALSRLKVPFNLDKIVLSWLLFVRMVHPIALLLPFFLIFNHLGLYNTKIALIAIYVAINMPLTIWMLKDFFEGLPESIEESALIDGCSRFQAFYKIALPLVAPGLVATAVFSFITVWNEYLIALILTSTPDVMTLPVGIARLSQQYFVKWGEISAAATIYVIPVFVFTSIVQRHLIRGLTFGAVKG